MIAQTHLLALALTSAPVHAQQAWSSGGASNPCTHDALLASDSYRVGSGDVVQVQVYGEADLSGSFPVDPAGSVVLPLVGSIPIQGLTADCIAVRLTEALADGYLRDPDVTVSLDGFRSQPVSVLGAVKSPGLYYLEGPTTVLQMLSKAGGVSSDGFDALRLTRAGNENDVVMIPYQPLLSEGRDNLILGAGDVLFVPDLTVTVLGSVKSPGDVPYKEGLTVSRCLAAAGGATDVANLGRVYIQRGDQRVRINVRRVLAGKDADMEVLSGDRIFVKESVF